MEILYLLLVIYGIGKAPTINDVMMKRNNGDIIDRYIKDQLKKQQQKEEN